MMFLMSILPKKDKVWPLYLMKFVNILLLVNDGGRDISAVLQYTFSKH